MRPRNRATLKKYGLTEADFTALFEAHGGRCAICRISEDKLQWKFNGPDDWPADQVLHIDHEHGSDPVRVRGLLCRDCNYGLEAYIRRAPVVWPGRRGASMPKKDPRFPAYLKRGS